MQTFIIILVLIVLFVLLGGAAWFFGKESGPGGGTAWLTGTRQIRGIFTSLGNGEKPFSSGSAAWQSGVAVTDDRLDEMREEITRTLALGDALETRLRNLEQEVLQARQLPEAIDARVQQSRQEIDTLVEQSRQEIDAKFDSVSAETRQKLSSMRREVAMFRNADSPNGLRRTDAIRDLYQRLAQLEVALAAVINPMLLPGEPVSVPTKLYEDTMVWENWGDVADKAFAFGESFSKSRLLLEPELAEQVQGFISSFREELTGTVYPIVQSENPTPNQKQQIRAGLETVVDGIHPIRREFEKTWQANTRLNDVQPDESDIDA